MSYKVVKKFSDVLTILSIVFAIGGSAYSQDIYPREIKNAYNDPNNFHFAVMGDRAGSERKGIFPVIIKEINLLKPAFVVSVGDNVKGHPHDVNTINAQWDEFDNMMKSFTVPFLNAAGNHDISNSRMAEIYYRRYGNPYYYTKYKNVLFLFLNTADPDDEVSEDVQKKLGSDLKTLKQMVVKQGYTQETRDFQEKYEDENRELSGSKISDEQFNYFARVLEENKNVRWTFVLMHERAWKQKKLPENWVKLEKILSSRNYTVFAGHEHFYEYAVRNGRDYIGVATCGGGWSWPETKAGVFDHILYVTMNGNEPVIANMYADSILDKTKAQVHRTDVIGANKD
jgi:hypothetical protein